MAQGLSDAGSPSYVKKKDRALTCIPLQLAAKKAYENNVSSLCAGIARRMDEGDAGSLLSWFASALIGGEGEANKIKVFGYKANSKVVQEVPLEEFSKYGSNLIVTKDSAYLEDIFSKEIRYSSLHINNSDMEKLIKVIDSWG